MKEKKSLGERVKGFFTNLKDKMDWGLVTKIAFAVVFVGVVLQVSRSIYDLFTVNMLADSEVGNLAVLGSVGVTITTVLLIIHYKHTMVRALAGFGFVLMSALTLFLISLRVLLMAQAANLSFVTVPLELANLGGVSIGIISTVSFVLVLAIPLVLRTVEPMRYKSVASAFSVIVGLIVAGVVIVASTAANYFFGVDRGVPPFVAIFVAMLYEGIVVWAFLKVAKAGKENEQLDFLLWSIILIVTGTFIGLVGWKTLSTLSNFDTRVPLLDTIGADLYTLALAVAGGVAYFTHIFTERVNGTIPEILARFGKFLGGSVRGVARFAGEMIGGAAKVPGLIVGGFSEGRKRVEGFGKTGPGPKGPNK